MLQEREGIVSELDKLRYINTKMMDEQDSKMVIKCIKNYFFKNEVLIWQNNGFSRQAHVTMPERNLFSDCEVDHEDDVFDVKKESAGKSQKIKGSETTSLLDEINETLASGKAKACCYIL